MASPEAQGFTVFCGPDVILPPREAGGAGSGIVLEETAWIPEDAPKASFSHGGRAFTALQIDPGRAEALPPGFRRYPLRQYIGESPESESAFALKAHAYANWSTVARHCMACGTALVQGVGNELGGARVCPSCGKAFFPRLSPAVIVLVTRDDKILLGHNAKFPAGRHSLLAGFVEPGETLEETVRREVLEESGIEIGEPHYVRSQPWPFPDSLMLAFEAEYVSGEPRPDGEEIDHVDWFSLDSLPDLPPRGSVARAMIDRFIAGRRKPSGS